MRADDVLGTRTAEERPPAPPVPPVATQPQPWDDGSLAELSGVLFASLVRSDQRRRGDDYIRGLLRARGRRSIRNIAIELGGSATEQSLHHFISSSTWDWVPVRRALSRHLDSNVGPLAWVVRPMVIPKTGENSVGVERQYIPEAGQVINAQRAVGVWAATEETSSPVNWRLHLSPSWAEDWPRRRQASVPDDVVAQSLCDSTIDACLQAASWGPPGRPVVLDARGADVPAVVQRFRAAGVPFLLRIGAAFRLSVTDRALVGRGTGPLPAGQIVLMARDRLRPVIWRDHTAALTRYSLAASLRVRLPAGAGPDAARADLTLLGVTEDRRRLPADLWITDLVGAQPSELVRLSRLTGRVQRNFEETADRLGIRDYTGRSYNGWHRHMTLASAAHAVAMLKAAGRPA
ncbi:IS701 family transposase [Streptomyces polygonati]|uniref:IS701 family transposase n=1 Tax=Streptomyces polygonati TaxID=1617087 RepID=A0ABV8HLN1_9ACTN